MVPERYPAPLVTLSYSHSGSPVMVVVRCCKVTERALALAKGVFEKVTFLNKPLQGERKFLRDMGQGRTDIFKLLCRLPHCAPHVLPHIEHSQRYISVECLPQDNCPGLFLFLCKCLEDSHFAGIVTPAKG